jgi:predicted AAA+ superfamily ATPase
MFRRRARAYVERALTEAPVVFLAGPRCAGKSTLAILMRQAGYTTLDWASTRAAAAVDPADFVAGSPPEAALDEVLRVPGLVAAIRGTVAEDPRAGRFLLTGSLDMSVNPGRVDTPTNRIEALPCGTKFVPLWPLSQGEIDGAPDGFVDAVFGAGLPNGPSAPLGRDELAERVLRGGFPEAVQRTDDERSTWFESYLAAALGREIRAISSVADPAALRVMLRLLAERTGSPHNRANLARVAELTQSTGRRYFDMLRAVFLVVGVPAWTTSRSTHTLQASKQFLVDIGLTAHVLGVDRERLANTPALADSLLEAFVAMELRKQVGWSTLQPSLAHFHTREGEKVDLVLEAPDGALVGVEVTTSATVRDADFAGLRVLAALAGERFRRGVVLYTGEEIVPFGENLLAAPVQMVWQAG